LTCDRLAAGVADVDDTGQEWVFGAISTGVAGVALLRPNAMPDGLNPGYNYRQACTDLGLADTPPGGVAVWATYHPKGPFHLEQASVVTRHNRDAEEIAAAWADHRIVGIPEFDNAAVLHIAAGWLPEGYMTLNPTYAAFGWEGLVQRTIPHPLPDLTNGEHCSTSGIRRHAGVDVHTISCDICAWKQRLDDIDALDDGADRLAPWHAAHPAGAVNHMAPTPPVAKLAVPTYVAWEPVTHPRNDNELVVFDQRTGIAYHHGHRFLAVYEQLMASNVPGQNENAHTDAGRWIHQAADELYQRGLLVPNTSPWAT
jgi:hypothetical protein